jgi:Ethanolamine utilization protein EutJ (predicted chaperonin)
VDVITTFRDFVSLLQAAGPYGVIFFVWWQGQKENKKWEERFEAVKRMYENNVELVKHYEKLADEQQDITIMVTEAVTELKTIIKERLK